MLGWTEGPEGTVEQLKSLWESGLSAGKIAVEMGITRNKVIGKLDRLGLLGTRSNQKKEPGQRLPRSRKPRVVYLRTLGIAVEVGPQEPSSAELDKQIPQEQRRTLMQLTVHTCHYPVGHPHDSDFFFCGAQALEGKVGLGKTSPIPYCSRHARVAYRPPGSRGSSKGVVLGTMVGRVTPVLHRAGSSKPKGPRKTPTLASHA